jgi:hypothetical protein
VTTPAHGRGGSTPPRPPATGKPQQWFVLRPWVFDVTAAIALLRAAPRPPLPLPVEPWARAYGLLPAPRDPHTVSLIGPVPGFDPEYAMGTDLDEPAIIATITSPAGESAGPLLIDGCHRLYKAARLGREHLPSFVLTAAETLTIRHDAILGPPCPPGRRRAGRRENRP